MNAVNSGITASLVDTFSKKQNALTTSQLAAVNSGITQSLVSQISQKATLLDVYPVGSIYMSVNEVNPATLFGGTWERIKDRFLLASGDTYSNGATGGEATHKLTIDELPTHNHNIAGAYGGLGDGGILQRGYQEGTVGKAMGATYTGKDIPHNNMPPYLAVYMWKRTA